MRYTSAQAHDLAGGRQQEDRAADAVDLEMQVLVVDDYKTMLRTVGNLLKQIGFKNVDEANDGNEALAKLRGGSYGLVISDWKMRPMSGLDLLKQVRADARLGGLPFVMITAEDREENLAAARHAGVDGYIVKPFNAATLKRNLTPILGSF